MTVSRRLMQRYQRAARTAKTVPCNYCGTALPIADEARAQRVAHYDTCPARPFVGGTAHLTQRVFEAAPLSLALREDK